MKLEFLALKWAITEQFREYLQYRPFTVLMDNNPLTYILKTPNLDALGHRWVTALASYNMTIKYLKGSDNKVADALSWIETRLDPETVTELLNHTKASAPRAEVEDIRIIEEEERADQEVILRTTQLAHQDKRCRAPGLRSIPEPNERVVLVAGYGQHLFFWSSRTAAVASNLKPSARFPKWSQSCAPSPWNWYT